MYSDGPIGGLRRGSRCTWYFGRAPGEVSVPPERSRFDEQTPSDLASLRSTSPLFENAIVIGQCSAVLQSSRREAGVSDEGICQMRKCTVGAGP